MKPSIKRQLETFFEQFSDFSKRAEEHWPLNPESKDSYTEIEIGYDFLPIITRSQLEDPKNREIIDSFFILYNNPKSIFSCGPIRTSATVIRDQIQDLASLQSALSEKYSSTNYSFLLLGTKKKGTQKTLIGCVGHYFPASRSVLIESVSMADVLFDGPRGSGTRNKEEQISREQEEQKVLGWLLTYQQKQRSEKGGLYKVIDFIEENVFKVPFKANFQEGERKNIFPGDAVFAIFHEVINPVLVPVDNNLERGSEVSVQRNAAKILLAFNSIGARYLRFAYRHPQIEQPFVNNKDRDYLLLAFPQVPKTKNYLTLETSIVMSFVVDYFRRFNPEYLSYSSDLLDCKEFLPGEAPVLKGFINKLGKNPITLNSETLFQNRLSKVLTDVYLHNVPRLEQPRFSYKRASIGFEIIVDEDYFLPLNLHPYHHTVPDSPEPEGIKWFWEWFKNKIFVQDLPDDPKALYCQVAHSGETDLFAYKYQSEPPYFTRYYGLRASNVTVHFPSHFEFTSEGRAETFYCLPTSADQVDRLVFNEEKVDPQTGEKKMTENPLPYFSYDIKVTACVSYTYFLKSAVRVWHLVLKPNAEVNNGISELDIIKLMKFFSGSQEHENDEQRQIIMRQIKFTIDKPEELVDLNEKEYEDLKKPGSTADYEPDGLIKLLYDLTNVKYVQNAKSRIFRTKDKLDEVVSLRNVRSGVVEIDTGDVTAHSREATISDDILDATNFLGFYDNPDAPALSFDDRNEIRQEVQNLYKSLYNDQVQMSDEPEPFSAAEYADYVFKSYCGICLGIFDYDRMGFQEIDDTLVPLPDSKTEESFMVIHRGVLAMLGYNDDVMDTFWNTLGINAYLLIPSAVLAHNDFVSRDAEKRLDKMLKNLRFEKSNPSIKELFTERNFIDDLLNDDILGDVFQYKTEQELYKEGMERRGISERIKDGKSKLEQLDKLISDKKEERSALNQKIIQVFLTLLSLVSLYTPLRDLYVDEIGYKTVARPESQTGNNSDLATAIAKSKVDSIEVVGEKQSYKVKWPEFTNENESVKWLFPDVALDAAHRHIFIFSIIILFASVLSIIKSPASLVYIFFYRMKKESRKLPIFRRPTKRRTK